MGIQQMLLGGGGVVVPLWNPSDKSASITLTNGDATATKTAAGDAWVSVRSVASKSTGKWYAEVLVALGGGTGPDMLCGLANSSMPLTNFCGQDTNSYGFYARNGQKATNNVFTAYGSSHGAGAVIGIAYDASAGNLWFAKDGTWQASGNPGAGTGAAFTSVAAGMFIAGSIFNGSSIQAYTLRLTAASQTYSPPSGFSAWS